MNKYNLFFLFFLFLIQFVSFYCSAINWPLIAFVVLGGGPNPDQQSGASEFSDNPSPVIQHKGKNEELLPSVIKMLSFNLGLDWIGVAEELGVDQEVIDSVKRRYTDKRQWKGHNNVVRNRPQFYESIELKKPVASNPIKGSVGKQRKMDDSSPLDSDETLVPLHFDEFAYLKHDPRIVDAISFFLAKVLEKCTISELFFAIKKTNVYLAECAEKTQMEGMSPEKTIEQPVIAKNGMYDSYIFLQWVKHPSRIHQWGHILPNTELLPHQQTVCDWAIKNPDKLVALWFDSSGLTDDEVSQYYNFEQELNAKVNNVVVLDVRSVSWCNVELKYYFFNSYEETCSPLEALNTALLYGVGERVDFLRERLLYEGGHAIETALKNSGKGQELYDKLPHRGVYFDLDFLPRTIDSSDLFRKKICIDDTLRAVSGYAVKEDGRFRFGGHFSNSLIVVNQDHLDLLGERLYVEVERSAKSGALRFYAGLKKTLRVNREEVGGTRDFRMRGCMGAYKGDLLPAWGLEEHRCTWCFDPNDHQLVEQKNRPLHFEESIPVGP